MNYPLQDTDCIRQSLEIITQGVTGFFQAPKASVISNYKGYYVTFPASESVAAVGGTLSLLLRNHVQHDREQGEIYYPYNNDYHTLRFLIPATPGNAGHIAAIADIVSRHGITDAAITQEKISAASPNACRTGRNSSSIAKFCATISLRALSASFPTETSTA